jgi:hypothetical protein
MVANSSEHTQPLRIWIKDISEEEEVRGVYLVKEKRLGRTRNGKLFISITLADRTGAL